MRRLFSASVATAALVAGTLGAVGPVGTANAADPAYNVITGLHFKVTVGPADDERCDVVGDVYVPKDASPSNRLPAVLATNGFGGSKDDQAGLSKLFASRGYIALSYSGLGFGGSSCDITLDHPDWDGKAASQLIDYLGGKDGVAYTDLAHTAPAPALDSVKLDAPGDPRVGMFGGSYGGQVQYAAASVDPRLDTIVPIITWNDLSYSLAPNNTSQSTGVSTVVPGAAKLNWALGFSGLGLTGDLVNQQPPSLTSLCPNFADFVCPALLTAAVTGTLRPADTDQLRAASVSSYLSKVKIPTLILQGQADTLFNLNEAVATYEALKAQNTPVKMSWIEYGHSGKPAPGEIDFGNPDPATQHITKRISDWFDHHLKGIQSAPTGPEFSYFRPWVDYSGIATPAYSGHGSYPIGTTSTYHLSSTPASSLAGGTLLTDRSKVTVGNYSFTTLPAPLSNAEDPDVLGSFIEKPEVAEGVTEVPGTFAHYDTDVLTEPVDVVGSPQVRLRVEAPSAGLTQGQDTGKLVVFLKVSDVAPGGTAKVVRNLAAPVRVPDVGQPFTVTMPAFVHRFAPGHRIRLVVAGASPNYRVGNTATPVGIVTAPDAVPGGSSARSARAGSTTLPLQSITLPTLTSVPSSTGITTPPVPTPAVPTPGADPAAGAGVPDASDGRGKAGKGTRAGGANTQAQAVAASTGNGSLPNTGGPPLGLLGAGLLLMVLGVVQLARRRSSLTI